MKKVLTSLILIAPLMLTACGSSQPTATEYPSMIEWYQAMDSKDSPITCEHREAKTPPLIPSAKYQVMCTDQEGAEANLLIFDSNDDMRRRFEDIQAFSDTWPVLVGPNWTVDCKTDSQCERWQKGFGGDIRKSNEVSVP
ncbi:TPA: hypothetical protein I8V59_001587 [Corynebacterium striatum]|nr:hypothetical protein [Corynebacterium striatum]